MDKGRVFFSLEFDSFCADNGIHRIKIIPFTLYENGAVERMNREILEKAHCILSHVGLGKDFWGRGINNTTIYLIN